MRIPVVDALVERRDEKRRKAKVRKIVRWTIAVVAAVLVLFSFVVSLVNAIERWIDSRDERRRKWRAFVDRIKDLLPRKKTEPVYYMDGFNESGADDYMP